MAETVLQLFYSLAEDEKAIDSTTSLVEKLKSTASDSVVYSWKRLIKGMSSNRKNARQGFAIALTEVLTQFPEIDSQEVYDFCKTTNLPTGHVSQKEIRDLYAGFIFCISALHRSGRLAAVELRDQVLTELLPILLKKKLTIKDAVFKVFIDILDAIETKDLKKVVELFGDDLKEGWTGCTLERLALMAYLEKRDGAAVSKLLKNHWSYSHLIHPQNYEKIAVVLKTVACEEFMKPQLAIIIDNCSASKSFSVKKVNKHFFKVEDSGENKNTVVFMLTHMLPSIGDDKLDSFVVKNMMGFLLKPYMSSPESVQTMTDSLCTRVGSVKCSDSKLVLAKAFLPLLPLRASCLHKVLETLFSTVNRSDTLKFTKVLESSFLCPENVEGKTTKMISEFRNDCLSWMFQVLRLSDAKTVFDYTKLLFIYSFFSVKAECVSIPSIKIPSPAMSQVTIDFCKAKFNSCLKLLSASQSADKTVKRRGIAEDGRYWVYHLLSSSLSLVTNEKFPMITDITGHKEWQTLWSVIDEVEAKTPETRSDEDWAFELLFLHAGMLFFEEQKQARIILKDVNLCYEKHKNGSKENWKSVFVDLLISILSYESLMLRNIACGCFKLVCADLDKDSIQLIMDAIDTSDKGDDDEAGEDADSEEESDEESDADDEEEDGLEDLEVESSDEDDEESDEEDDDDESMDDEEGSFADENKSQDEIMVEEDEDDEEEDINLSDADEEDLKNEDKALGAAMKGLLDMKKDKKKEKRNKALKKVKMVHFKIKILDLIEILVENVGFSTSTMNILPGLLKLVASPVVTSGPVYNRVLGIFKNMFNMKADKLTVNFNEALKSDVPAIQTFITKTSNRKAQQLAVQSLFMLCKVHLNNPEPKKKKRKSTVTKEVTKDQEVCAVFNPLMEDFFTNKHTKLDKTIFYQMIERLPVLRPGFVVDLLKYLDQDIALFAKMQSINLLNRILSFGDEAVLKCNGEILESMGKFLSVLVSNENPSPHHIREVVKLCQKLHSAATKNKVELSAIPEGLTSALESVPVSGVALKFPDLASLAVKMLRFLNN